MPLGWPGDATLLPGSRSANWGFSKLGLGPSDDPLGTRTAAEEQQAAQLNAEQQTQAQLLGAQGLVDTSVSRGQSQIAGGMQQGAGAIQGGTQDGLASLYGGVQQGAGAMQQGYSQAGGHISRLQGQAGPQAYDVTGQYGGTLDQLKQGAQGFSPEAIQSQAMRDPGAAFREKSAMDALSRRQAASGGRMSGRAMSELAQLSSGLASQEYGASYNRAMGSQQARQQAMAQAGGMELSALQNQAGRSDAMGQYGRSRLDALGGHQAQMAMQQGSQLGGLYAGAGQQAGQMQQAAGSQLGQMYFSGGQAQAGLGMQGTQAQLGLIGQSIDARYRAADTAGMDTAARGAGVLQGASLFGNVVGGLLKSDKNLKRDISDGNEAALQLLEDVSPKTFRYLEGMEEGKLLGVIAQDLEQSEVGRDMVVETEIGKAIEPHRAISMLLGVVAHLHGRIKDLEER